MKVLLIQPASNIIKSKKEGKPALQPLGLAYIAGTLIANGYKDVKILDVLTEGYYHETPFKKDYIRYGLSPKEIKRRIKEFNPDIVGVSCICNLRQYQTIEICKLAKEVSERIATVVGGNPVTTDPKWFLRKKCVDFAILGEGEQPFLDLVSGRGIDDIDGIAFRELNGSYTIKPQKVWRKDVDNIPFPAHHLLALDNHLDIWNKEGYHYYPARKFTSMVMARGCP
jgi:magnesium-protoporphyrin IX monomethyl ester (oxidative) cyclase